MMTEIEFLLNSLADEGVEVSQRSLKAQKFGINEIQALGPSEVKTDDALLNNAERIRKEYADLLGVYEMFVDRGLLVQPTREMILAKKVKVAKYMDYARSINQLEPLPTAPKEWRCGNCGTNNSFIYTNCGQCSFHISARPREGKSSGIA